MEQTSQELDSYEIELNQKLEELQMCQNSNSLDSCFNCEKLINCQIRNEYVKAVYNSMSKGESGGFEF
jgi:PP-loop superfamily ATP-utilizing enzyme